MAFLGSSLDAWLPAAVAVVAGLLLGIFLRRLLVTRVARMAQGTATRMDDVLVEALRGPIVLWCVVLGLHAAAQLTSLPPAVARLIPGLLVAIVLGSATWILARVASEAVSERASEAASVLPSATLVPNAIRLLVLGLGGLVLLQTLGVSITPILTALGVGGLAVALALQDTLANFFAGVHILLTRKVRPGDFVKLDSGEDGFVVDVTWRNTTIRQLSNNLVIVPNARLASTIATNFNLPDAEMGVLVEVGVSYDSDLSHVEGVTVEVAREVLREVEGGVPTFEPLVRFTGFGDSAVQLVAILRVKEFVGQFLVKHEFVKRLHERYRREGIEIPFPIRTVHLRGAEAPMSASALSGA